MRGVFITIIAFSGLLLSCGRQPEPVVEPQPLPFSFDENLLRIDSLMQQRPDSALVLLLDKACLVPTGCDELSRNGKACIAAADVNDDYRSLLLSEALYKTGTAQLNRFRCETFQETSLQEAVRCFDSLAAQYPGNDDIAVLSARAHYMNGVGFYENDSVVEACKEYLKTLEIMENRFDESELVGYKAKFMCLTYNRLAELYFDQFMAEQSIYFSRKALHYCEIMPTSKYGIANTLHKIGNNYDIYGLKDSAFYYYNLALEFLPDSNNVIYRDLISSRALLAYSLDFSPEKPLQDLRQVMEQADNMDELVTRHIVMGYIFYEEKNYDSAAYYLESVFETKTDNIAKFQPAEYLYSIYLNKGDTIKSHKYSDFLANNAIGQYDNISIVSTLNNCFRDYLGKMQQPKIGNEKKAFFISAVIALLMILCIIIVQKIKNDRRLKENNEKSRKKLEEEYCKHNDEKAILLKDIEQTNNKILELSKELGIKTSGSEIRREALLKEPVCKKIFETVGNLHVSARDNYYTYKLALSDEMAAELHAAVLKHSERFDAILLDRCPKLKQDNLMLCYLLLLGLDKKQVAVLKGRSYYAINKQINNVKKLLNIDKDLSDYIMGIL